MALTITQELQLLNEGETPGTGIGPEINPLSELIYQAGIGESVDFLASAKNVDEPTNPSFLVWLLV